MKVLLVSTSDINNGSARAAYRLHEGLKSMGINSKMLVQEKLSNDDTVLAPKTRLEQGIARAKLTIESLPLKVYRKRDETTFSIQWLPDRIVPRIDRIEPDIINLHWMNLAYAQIETLAKLKLPLVWSLHDMWAFTGGCHYNQDCDRYTGYCGKCPQLGSTTDCDLSRWVWQRKAKAWKKLNLTIVALSHWLGKCAKDSSLFQDSRIEIIPNGIDTQKYKPINRQVARELLNLPQDKQLILFGCLKATGDRRKGFHLLQPALQDLSKSGWQDKLELVVFGAGQPEHPPDFGFKSHYLNTLSDDLSIVLVYSAADVFVLPSVQDNLPNTIMEAIACGIPCVAFNIGGIPDMIDHEKNGYLAQPYKTEDLAQGIAWVLENKERHQKLGDYAREKAKQEFAMEIQARRYLSLFAEVFDR